jgi:hypothetical protein
LRLYSRICGQARAVGSGSGATSLAHGGKRKFTEEGE